MIGYVYDSVSFKWQIFKRAVRFEELCLVFCKMFVLQLQTECKADNVLAVTQTWSED